jgi:hypothetical protein
MPSLRHWFVRNRESPRSRSQVLKQKLALCVVNQAALAAVVLLAYSTSLVAQCVGAATGDVPRPSWPCSGTGGTPVAQLNSAPAVEPGRGQQAPAEPQTPSPNPLTYPANRLATGSKRIGIGVIATLPPPIDQKRLTPRVKFQIYVYQNYGPQNFILPAFSAAFTMANPPSGYPREWEDGGGAFGRWYGAQFVSSTSNRTARLLAQIAFHEDPRYVPSGSKNVVMRISHALAFTFIDKTDSGHNTFAFSNFAGAAAGGFVGMGFYPDGHNDMVHAE